ncbi:MAG: TPM domain-containing protein [Balneolaceae bacterium]|nr:TPM domain-containing protein [Balneolaceae bacterium]
MARLLSKEQEKHVMAAIKEAETNTSGEIRVHLEDRCKGDDPIKRAIEVFGELHMHETELRNGVIVYVAIKDHKIAVWGDEGIHTKVGQNFWDDVLKRMTKYFQAGDFETGLSEAILMIGDKLKDNFPYQTDDKNELSDDISYGESDA